VRGEGEGDELNKGIQLSFVFIGREREVYILKKEDFLRAHLSKRTYLRRSLTFSFCVFSHERFNRTIPISSLPLPLPLLPCYLLVLDLSILVHLFAPFRRRPVHQSLPLHPSLLINPALQLRRRDGEGSRRRRCLARSLCSRLSTFQVLHVVFLPRYPMYRL